MVEQSMRYVGGATMDCLHKSLEEINRTVEACCNKSNTDYSSINGSILDKSVNSRLQSQKLHYHLQGSSYFISNEISRASWKFNWKALKFQIVI